MNTIKDIVSYIKRGGAFLLATHISPEGDAIGSSLALSFAMEAMGKTTVVYDRDPVPAFCRFLPGHERVRNHLNGLDTEDFFLILLDCNDLERAGLKDMRFKDTAVIDHHMTGRNFGRVRWIQPGSAATGLMVFHLIKELGQRLTKDIAINLYTAIAVDTGIFRYNNTTADALRAAAELVEAGAEPNLIAEGIYETWSSGRFRLFIKTLNALEIVRDIAIMVITKAMLEETGTTLADTDNFPGYPRIIKDINVSALFKEVERDTWKVSLRSKRGLDVSAVAEGFGGGGHKNASGYTIKADLGTARELLLRSLKKNLP